MLGQILRIGRRAHPVFVDSIGRSVAVQKDAIKSTRIHKKKSRPITIDQWHRTCHWRVDALCERSNSRLGGPGATEL